MIWKYTPPLTPEMDDESMQEIEEDDIAEVINLDDDENVAESDQDNDTDDSTSSEHLENIAETDDALIVFKGHKDAVLCGTFHPEVPNVVATGGVDEKVYIWNCDNGEILQTLGSHEESVELVAYSHDGLYLATADLEGIVNVWRHPNYSNVCHFDLGDEIKWLEWHERAHVLLVASAIGMVQMYKIPSGETKLVLPGYGKDCTAGKIFPDGKRLACGFDDGSVKFVDMKHGSVLHEIKNTQQASPINCIDVYTDNNLVLSGTEDGRLLLTKSQTGKVASHLISNTSTDSIESVKFSSSVAASGSLDGQLIIWDISRQVERHKKKLDCGISKIIWENDNLLYTSLIGNKACMFDSRTGNVVLEYYGHTSHLLNMALSPNGQKLMTTSEDTTARIYQTNMMSLPS